MKDLRIIYFSLLIIFSPLFVSCIYDVPIDIDWDISSYSPDVIKTSTNHLAFPDLINHDSTWYLAYREADDHVYKTFSRIVVLQSKNFKEWKEINKFELDGWDLRDPKFSYNDFDDKLYLHVHAASISTKNEEYGTNRQDIFWDFKLASNNFGNIYDYHILKDHINNKLAWKWRPMWYDNKLLVAAYLNNVVTFYKYDNILDYPVQFGRIGRGSETSMTVKKDTLYFITRTDTQPIFGKFLIPLANILQTSQDSNTSITYSNLNINGLGGPNMIIYKDTAYIAGRVKDENYLLKTMIYKYSMNSKVLEHSTTLISYGDNSYPGMILLNDTLYGVYYTSTNDAKKFQIRSFLYPL